MQEVGLGDVPHVASLQIRRVGICKCRASGKWCVLIINQSIRATQLVGHAKLRRFV